MYHCPACGAEDITARSTCSCGADLSLLEKLDAVADAWFNRALEALSRGAPGQALEWVSASCAARPTDAAARRAQAKLWAQLGRPDEASDSLARAVAIDPEAPEAALLRQALDEAAGSANGKGPGGRRKGKRPRRGSARKRIVSKGSRR